MSSGPFDIGIYEADSGEKHNVKFQPESTVFSIGGSPNTLPAGPATSPFWAEIGKGKKEYGLRPRKIRIRWTGPPPDDYADCSSLEIVVFDAGVYTAATIGSAATYLGATAKIVGKIPEQMYPIT